MKRIGNIFQQIVSIENLTIADGKAQKGKSKQYGVKAHNKNRELNIKMLHKLFFEIQKYLSENLKLEIKNNYQVFPVESRGIDFVGYVHFHTHVLLRKSIKRRFARMLKRNPRTESIASYTGWTKHCNSYNLLKKLLSDEQFQRLKY